MCQWVQRSHKLTRNFLVSILLTIKQKGLFNREQCFKIGKNEGPKNSFPLNNFGGNLAFFPSPTDWEKAIPGFVYVN